ncbi:unnamed protein product [Rotaria magnacalcarata]|uniref:Uncharacterized protein n=1 Tax=Rotaria magnacalcarata TaxID=392030 RepID=A0A8S3CYW7_9BILA|nr:unnamed protein product [Rotaria magnacalcarata]CAF4965400.1 unnamed protein product [Rotaria magnacalcarata]
MEEFYKSLDKHIESLNYKFQDKFPIKQLFFRDLRDVDSTTLPTMTFIQACKAYVSAGLITLTEACNCNGKFSTKKCRCRAAKVQCGTKCHSSKTKPCSNV